MNTMETQREELILFAVPMLPPERKVPVAVQSIALVKKAGAPDVMRVVIKRDLSVKIESFTFRYRFSNLPVYAADTSHRFNTYVYTEEDINSSAQITFNGAIPSSRQIEGCSVYISEIKLTSGLILSFEPSEFRFVLRPKRPQAQTFASDTPISQTPPPPASRTVAERPSNTVEPQTSKASNQTKQTPPSKKKHIRFTVILTVVLFMLAIEAIGFIYLNRYTGIKNSADMLMEENRYNEAYKIVSDTNYNGLLQRVCEKATVYYFSVGDLESAYVYACAAPDPFTDTIIEYAAQSVVSLTTGEINENAFRVAKMTEDDARFDSIIRSMSDVLTKNGDYANALRVVSELRDEDGRGAVTEAVFTSALNHYISENRYDTLIAFIDEMAVDTTFKRTAAEILDAAIDACATLGDNAGILYLADHYSDISEISAAQTVISAGDRGVRAKFSTIYPMLTADQKRAYHAQSITLWNSEVIQIEAGRIDGTKITDAVSIERNSELLLVLHKDGSVTLHPDEDITPSYEIPSYADIVQIALSEDHAVLLHANGTVSAFGDNTDGQCNVTEWTDIAAIAVGQRFTVGLKTDGTLVAIGSNTCGQCDVSLYNNVVDIAAANQTTVILFLDGTVKLQGFRSLGLADADKLTGVTRIKAASAGILAEKKDGRFTLVSAHLGGSFGDPYNWRGIVSFDVGSVCIAGIDKNGVIYTSGDGLPKS